MFVKITKSKEFKNVYSYRDNGKVKQEMFCNLGRSDQLRNNPAWQKIAINFVKLIIHKRMTAKTKGLLVIGTSNNEYHLLIF